MTFINKSGSKSKDHKIKKKSSSEKKEEKSFEIKDKIELTFRKDDGFMSNHKALGTLKNLNRAVAGAQDREYGWKMDKGEISGKADFNIKKYDPDHTMKFVKDYNNNMNIPPDRLKGKYDLMRLNPHTFFRAMPALFYYDIKNEFSEKTKLLDAPAPTITVVGDMHLANTGTFKGPHNEPVWGINDFDQTAKGSPEWDLERLAASVVLAGRESGIDDDKIGEAIESLSKKYYTKLKEIATGEEKPHPPYLTKKESDDEIKDLIKDVEDLDQKEFLKDIEKINLSGPEYFTEIKDKILPLSSETKAKLLKNLPDYEKNIGSTPRIKRPLKILDIAEKLGSGGSSFGLPRYYVLVENSSEGKAPVLLELKEIFPSGIKDQTGNPKLAKGKEIVENKRELQQGLANSLYSSLDIDGYSFLVREREAEKENTPIEEFDKPKKLNELAKHAGKIMAYAHCPSASQAKKIYEWLNKDPEKALERLKEFAFSYADKTQKDYKAFKEAF